MSLNASTKSWPVFEKCVVLWTLCFCCENICCDSFVVTYSGTVVTHSGASQNESRREWVTRRGDSLTQSGASQNESRWEWVTRRRDSFIVTYSGAWRYVSWRIRIVALQNESQMSHKWVTNGSRMSHDECVTTHIFIAKTERLSMTHSHRDSCWAVTHSWLICVVTHSGVWRDALKCVPCPIHICDMTYSNVLHDSFARVCLCVYICDMTHSDVCIFVSVSWLIRMCDITHSWLIHLRVKNNY